MLNGDGNNLPGEAPALQVDVLLKAKKTFNPNTYIILGSRAHDCFLGPSSGLPAPNIQLAAAGFFHPNWWISSTF
jgi:hypothetical protein